MKFCGFFLICIVALKSCIPLFNTMEVAKVPFLLAHYQEHKERDRLITFFEFLRLHYTDKNHQRQEHSKHNKLPFHGQQNHNVNLQLWYERPYPVFVPKIIKNILLFILSEGNYLNPFKAGIWQPPRN